MIKEAKMRKRILSLQSFAILIILSLATSISFASQIKNDFKKSMFLNSNNFTPLYVAVCDVSPDGKHHLVANGPCRLETATGRVIGHGFANHCKHHRYCHGVLFTEGNYQFNQVIGHYATGEIGAYPQAIAGPIKLLSGYNQMSDLPYTSSRYLEGYER